MVGAPHHARGTEAVYFFSRSVSGWHQTAEMLGIGPPDCCLGGVVAASGSTAVVVDSAVLMFTRTAAGWRQRTALKGSDTVTDDSFGNSVAITGYTIAVGAPDHASLRGESERVRKREQLRLRNGCAPANTSPPNWVLV